MPGLRDDTQSKHVSTLVAAHRNLQGVLGICTAIQAVGREDPQGMPAEATRLFDRANRPLAAES